MYLRRVLCENGCNVNARTSRGETALHMAVSCRQFNTEMINLLLSSGCNPNIQHNLGRQTALHMFIKKHVVSAELNDDVLEVFESLVKATDINIGDYRMRTPLHYTASCSRANLKLLQVSPDFEGVILRRCYNSHSFLVLLKSVFLQLFIYAEE